MCLDDLILQNRDDDRYGSMILLPNIDVVWFSYRQSYEVLAGGRGGCLEMWQFDYFMSLVLEGLLCYKEIRRHDSRRIVAKRGWEGKKGVLGGCCNMFKVSAIRDKTLKCIAVTSTCCRLRRPDVAAK